MQGPEVKYMKWCWENNIKIYPTPITPCGTKAKIIIDYGRKTVQGDEVYEKKAKTVNQQVKTAKGYSNSTVHLLGLYDKIQELYKTIYFKNNPNDL